MVDGEPKVTVDAPPKATGAKPGVEFKPVIDTEVMGMPVHATTRVGTRAQALNLQESKGYIYVNVVKPTEQPPQPYFAAGPSHDVLKTAIVEATPGIQREQILGGQLTLDPAGDMHVMNFENEIGGSNLEIAQTIMAMVGALPPELFIDVPLEISHYGVKRRGLPATITYEDGQLIGDFGSAGGRKPLLDSLESLAN